MHGFPAWEGPQETGSRRRKQDGDVEHGQGEVATGERVIPPRHHPVTEVVAGGGRQPGAETIGPEHIDLNHDFSGVWDQETSA